MRSFDIKKPEEQLRIKLKEKVDNLTKPKGSLGMLEELAIRVGMIQQTLSPSLRKPHNVLFAADHGIIDEGVSVSPKSVTHEQLKHFSIGGAGINFLCNQHGFRLVLVDAGVDADVDYSNGIINRKIGFGTRNFLHQAAMSVKEFESCIEAGAKIVKEISDSGCNVISFGEMGSGNTSSSAIWMHLLSNVALKDCVGAGAGLDTKGIERKLDVLQKALDNYSGSASLLEKIAWYGGYEMVMAVGGMLEAAEKKMVILVDGFIMTACMLVASYLNPNVMDYAIFSHVGDESGHKRLLDFMNVKPILNLSLRLGEGTGAVCAYPIVESAVRMINEMDSFQKGEVTKYFE